MLALANHITNVLTQRCVACGKLCRVEFRLGNRIVTPTEYFDANMKRMQGTTIASCACVIGHGHIRLPPSEAKMIDADRLFDSCVHLKSVSFPYSFGERLESGERMFADCRSLPVIILPDTFGPHLRNCDEMFAGCVSLRHFLSPLHFGGCLFSAARMFAGCRSLVYAAFPFGFGRSFFLNDVSEMFLGCKNMVTFLLPFTFGLNATDLDVTDMFEGCDALQEIAIYGVSTLQPHLIRVLHEWEPFWMGQCRIIVGPNEIRVLRVFS